jgi:hypothetical protein
MSEESSRTSRSDGDPNGGRPQGDDSNESHQEQRGYHRRCKPLATKAHGLDISGIKGKTTRQKPTTVKSNIVEIPDELLGIQQDLKVSMDGMTINSLKFLTAISHDLYYRTAQYVTNPVASVYKECMHELLTIYKKGGFKITDIHCDNEFRKAMDPFSAGQTPLIKMNYASAQEHVPRA